MAGLQYRDPVRAIDGDTVYPGAFVRVCEAGTETLVPIFADPDQTTPLSNPLVADAAGRLPAIYLDSTGMYRVRATDAAGNVFFDLDKVDARILPLALPYADPRDDNGILMPGATRTFYLRSTTELATVYADEALDTSLTNPVEADASGEFPAVWLDVTKSYRVILRDQHGRLIYDVEHLSFDVSGIPPTAPILSGELNDDDIDLEWTEAVSPFGQVAGYRLYDASDDSLIFDTQDPEDRDYTFGPVEEGQTYTFYVVAYDTDGNVSERSNIISFSVNVSVEIITQSRTWTKPANLLSVDVEIFGGGGGGAGGDALRGPGNPNSAGGGGGGERRIATFTDAELPDTVEVIIGAGGAGGLGAITASGSSVVRGQGGANGGDTSFGALMLAKGGQGGGWQFTTNRYLGGAGGSGGSGGDGTPGGGGGEGDTSNQSGTQAATDGESTSVSPAGGGGGGPLNTFQSAGRTGNGGSTSSSTGGEGGMGDISTTSGIDATGAPGEDGEDDAAGPGAGGGGGGCAGSQGGGESATGGNGGKGGKFGAGGGGGGAAQSNNDANDVAKGGDGGDGAPGAVILRYTYVE